MGEDFEVVTSGYADFEQDGVYYRRKRKLFLGAVTSFDISRTIDLYNKALSDDDKPTPDQIG